MVLTEGEKPPVEWETFKQLVLRYRGTGIPEINIPQSIILSDRMFSFLDEMQDAETDAERAARIQSMLLSSMVNPEEPFSSIYSELAERGRAIDTNIGGTKFLIENRINTNSRVTISGVFLTSEYTPNQIGYIHSHPVDVNPSPDDVVPLLMGLHSLEFIVTPQRIILLLANDETAQFRSALYSKSLAYGLAKGYLTQMGIQKGRHERAETDAQRMVEEMFSVEKLSLLPPELLPHIEDLKTTILRSVSVPNVTEDGWVVQFDDLSELNIPVFVAPRGSKLMIRK